MITNYFKYLLFVCGLILLSFSSCNKDAKPDLVPITMTGANTMGFYLNGEPINVKGRPSFSDPKGVNFGQSVYSNFYEVFSGTPGAIGNLLLYIHVDKLHSQTQVDLKGTYSNMGWAEILDRSPNGGTFFETDSVHVGKLFLTKFTDDVIAGTFEFTIYENSLPKYKVTDGRFDIKKYK